MGSRKVSEKNVKKHKFFFVCKTLGFFCKKRGSAKCRKKNVKNEVSDFKNVKKMGSGNDQSKKMQKHKIGRDPFLNAFQNMSRSVACFAKGFGPMPRSVACWSGSVTCRAGTVPQCVHGGTNSGALMLGAHGDIQFLLHPETFVLLSGRPDPTKNTAGCGAARG